MYQKIVCATLFASMLVACGDESDGASAALPPAETMYLAGPDEVTNESQALCASDSIAYQTLKAYIDAHNAEIEAAIDVLRAVVRSEQKKLQANGQAEYSVTIGERTVTLVATLSDDGELSYNATFTGPNVGTYALLSGNADADRLSGSWQIYNRNGASVITVTWTRGENGDLNIVRNEVNTDRSATYSRVGDSVTVVFAGINNEVTAAWSTTTGAGSVTVDGEAKLCFAKTADDFCTSPCAQ